MANPTEPMQVYDAIIDSMFQGQEGTVYCARPGRIYRAYRTVRAWMEDGGEGELTLIAPGSYGVSRDG